jgi:citrate lyase subunit beta/citryl-CoA lyase
MGSEVSRPGLEGMGCVHLSLIAVVHRAFAPMTAEIEKAKQVVAAYDDAQARSLGVVSLGSNLGANFGAKMIDAPVMRRAQNLIELARAMELLT